MRADLLLDGRNSWAACSEVAEAKEIKIVNEFTILKNFIWEFQNMNRSTAPLRSEKTESAFQLVIVKNLRQDEFRSFQSSAYPSSKSTPQTSANAESAYLFW